MRALTLGPEGTYSHRATDAIADEVDFVESVTGIVEGVASGEYERGVVPIDDAGYRLDEVHLVGDGGRRAM